MNNKLIDLTRPYYPQTNCDIVELKWQFGDGSASVSYADNPTHTYANPGIYMITATMKRRDGTTCSKSETVTVKDCGVNVTSIRDQSYQCGVRYKIRATTFHCNNTNAISYKLVFNNSTIPAQIQSTNEFTQIFICDGKYNITVEVTFADGCYSTAQHEITVTGTGNCPQSKDHQKHKDITTCSGYKINHHFKIYSSGILHRVYVKSVHYKKNGVGWWILNSAKNMEVSFWGKVIYGNNDCSNQTSVYPNGKTNSNLCTILYDYPIGRSFSVSREALHSSWRVKSSNSCSWASNNDEIKLHDNYCN